MSELAIRLFWLMGQVTLLALVAAVVSAVAARRRPGAGAGVAFAGLIGLVLLTVLTAIPLPAWWSWKELFDGDRDASGGSAALSTEYSVLSAQPAAGVTDAPRAVNSAQQADHLTPGLSLAGLRRLWNQITPAVSSAVQCNETWAWWGSAVLLGGASFCILRLLAGLYAVGRVKANSRLLEDHALLALLRTLQGAMRCERPVTVREAADLGGPVTIGWRRPAILLPPHWRLWREDELRAVLAHELAHVLRADFAAWLLARFSVALHFYHPLAHWLAGRLHLQQELAADALGAVHAGGRSAYLRTLARLALKQDETVCGSPARAFLPARGTLMRRIAMLRRDERSPGRAWPRWSIVSLLGAVVVGVSALRGPAQAGDKPLTKEAGTKLDASAATSGEKRAATQRSPFDYCFCAPDTSGFFAFRPSAFFSADPKMKQFAADANKNVADIMKSIGNVAAFPKVEEIEQVTGSILLKVDETQPKGQRGQLIAGLLSIRTVHEHDWKRTLDGMAKKVTEVQCEGQTYYKIALADFNNPAFFGVMSGAASSEEKCARFFLPDKRTLAICSEEQFKDMIHNGPAATPQWAKDAGWERVERGVFALAINNAEQRFSKQWLKSPPDEIPTDINEAVAKATGIVFGFDYTGELRFDLLASCGKQTAATAVADTIKRWLDKGDAAVRESRAKPDHDADPFVRLWQKLRMSGILIRSDSQKPPLVQCNGLANVSLAELVEVVSRANVEATEIKDK